MKKTAGFVAAAGLLATIFSGSAGAVMPNEPFYSSNIYFSSFGVVKDNVAAAPQAWGIEHEEQMRRDVKAFVDFMLNKVMPVMQNGDSLVKGADINSPDIQERFGLERRRFEMFDKLLSGCYGEPGLADYAWAANTMATWDQVGNEKMRTKDHANGKGYKSSLGRNEWQSLFNEFEERYQNNLRWVWELNNAFFHRHPDVKTRIEDLRHNGYAISEVYDRSAEGSALVISFNAEHAFAAHSQFMNDPAFAKKINEMNGTPVMKYRETNEKLMEKENRFLKPTVFWHFDHSMACKKPAQ